MSSNDSLDAAALGGVQGGLLASRGRGRADIDIDTDTGAESTPRVLLVGVDAATADALQAQLAHRGGADLDHVADADAARERLAVRRVDVVCTGAALEPAASRRLLDEADVADAETIVLAAGGDLALFQDLVDAERLYYLTPRPPPPPVVAALLESALEHHRAAPRAGDDAALLERSVVELVGRLASEPRLETVVRAAADEARRLVSADGVDCRMHDADDETLWRPAAGEAESAGTDRELERDSTAAGLVGFVARTGRSIRLDRVDDDPRYDAEADADADAASPVDGTDAGGNGVDHEASGARFLAVASRAAGPVLAVLVARRGPSAPPFTEADQRSLEALARQLSPVFDRFALTRRLEAQTPAIFRREAHARHIGGVVERGRPLQLIPEWTGWALALLVVLALSLVGFGLFGSIHHYASGPAVVRLGERLDVTTRLSGVVTSVEVVPGQDVAAGAVLARLDAAQEAAEVARLDAEYELALAQRLRDPFDAATGSAVGSLRAQRELARARLAERSVRAPRAGVVGDVRIRPGRHLAPGEVVVSLGEAAGAPRVVAFLPGHARPLLEPGMELRLELEGYRDAAQWLTIDSVGDEVVGPAEARRIVGVALVDTVPITGPVVAVHARLPSADFESQGKSYRVVDGVQATAEVRLRSEPIVATVLPGLDRFFGRTR